MRGQMHAGVMVIGLLLLLLGATASCGLGRGWDIREPEPARPGEKIGTRPVPSPPVPGDPEGAEAARPDFPIWIVRSGDGGQTIDTSGLPVRNDAVMFYESQFGLYPYIWQGNPQNGGVPVGLDLVAHIRELRKDIDRLIPDPLFDGLAVVDYESRGVLWKQIGEEYRELVREKIRGAKPMLRGEALEEASQMAYDEASKRFMQVTMGLAREMRPRATWGMYGYPAGKYEREDFGWYSELFDVMMPSGYPVKYSVRGRRAEKDEADASVFERAITNKVREGRAFAEDDQRVFLFVRTEYHGEINKTHGGQSINDIDARTILLHAEEAGADGVVFWCHARSAQKAQTIEADLRRLKPLMIEAIRRRREAVTD